MLFRPYCVRASARGIRMSASNGSTKLAAHSALMKQDWDARARENAKWYINTVAVNQTDEDFFASGKADLTQWWLPEFREVLGEQNFSDLKILEIGCGIGRMTNSLAEIFSEVWAVDVSGAMIEQGKEHFAHLDNIHWIESDGVSLEQIPDNYFELGFSVYVYQHVPSKEAIAANITNVYQKIQPGGFYLFLTNSVINNEYEDFAKDTWTGATFTAPEIRNLASEIGAQLVRLSGAGTQYCWTVLRKPADKKPALQQQFQPQILLAGQVEDLSISSFTTAGEQAKIGIIATGLDNEKIDCNSVQIIIGGKNNQVIHAGALRHRHGDFASARFALPLSELSYLEGEIPAGTETGTVNVALQIADHHNSNSLPIHIIPGAGKKPKIVTVRNSFDYGLDIYAQGIKSSLVLFVDYLPEDATTENVRLQLNDELLAPDFVGFVPKNSTWQVEAKLPVATKPGAYQLFLHYQQMVSEVVEIAVK